MTGASLKFSGILELKEALTRLPVELKGAATTLVLDTAHAAKDDMVAQYPLGPARWLSRKRGNPVWYEGGNLKKGVKVLVKEIGPVGVAAQVRNVASHAHLWEFGSVARHYVSKRGIWHRTGSMPRPPTPVFIPTMQRYRKTLYEKLAALLEAHGLTVTRAA